MLLAERGVVQNIQYQGLDSQMLVLTAANLAFGRVVVNCGRSMRASIEGSNTHESVVKSVGPLKGDKLTSVVVKERKKNGIR